MTDTAELRNLLFQSENHPLVPLEFENLEDYCLSLIHRKAYSRAAELSDGLEVLDLGCNNGYGTMTIADRCACIVGVDVSGNAIDAAKTTHVGPNIEYQVVHGGTLPFSDKTFDLVTSFQVIEHVERVKPYLLEIQRVLRDGGTAIFTTPNRCIRLEPGQEPWNAFHVREYEASELRNTLRAVFSDVRIEGLFAAPEFYKIEYDRAARAKAATKPSRVAQMLRSLIGFTAANALIDHARTILPNSLVRCMKPKAINEPVNIPTNAAEPTELSEFINRWSLSDLFYRDSDLNEALDLIAICSMPIKPKN